MADHDNPITSLSTERLGDDPTVLDPIGDTELVDLVADVLTVPPRAEPDSFVLHAPLELMARARLLPHVTPDRRRLARRRIAEIATNWLTYGEPVDTPRAGGNPADLADAIADGDLDATDRCVVALASTARDTDELVRLVADTALPYLGGAGHACIFLDHVRSFGRRPPVAVLMSRALLRDVARHPDWTLDWIENDELDVSAASDGRAVDLAQILATAPPAGDPGNNFIWPTMNLVDRSGLADRLLSTACERIPPAAARRQLLSVAAMSMLQDDPANAPYGWTHCLTMPQAALAIADLSGTPQRVVAIAATYVLGFRSTQSTSHLDMGFVPSSDGEAASMLRSGPAVAAALAWNMSMTARSQLIEQLATNAACHPDAHLAKYTLACLDAARTDADLAPLFDAASAYLATWWNEHDR